MAGPRRGYTLLLRPKAVKFKGTLGVSPVPPTNSG